MYDSSEAEDDPINQKSQRAMKSARGKQDEEQAFERRERDSHAASISKRRAVLRIDETEKLISSYFDPV